MSVGYGIFFSVCQRNGLCVLFGSRSDACAMAKGTAPQFMKRTAPFSFIFSRSVPSGRFPNVTVSRIHSSASFAGVSIAPPSVYDERRLSNRCAPPRASLYSMNPRAAARSSIFAASSLNISNSDLASPGGAAASSEKVRFMMSGVGMWKVIFS
ncbi:MAG: hypothetical protein HW373_908 [Deltaproteobacteria bacterium]|nr:hypothetical protein [Deltaproteobacteria bacterium]